MPALSRCCPCSDGQRGRPFRNDQQVAEGIAHRYHPAPRHQIANRKRKGVRSGRPVDFDSEAYKGRSVVEQSFNIFKQWRSNATRYD
ncbi:hypothetical protein [Arthrobacter sp. TMN-50]